MSLSRIVLPIAMASCVLFAGPALAQEQTAAPIDDPQPTMTEDSAADLETDDPVLSDWLAEGAEMAETARAEAARARAETARLQELAEETEARANAAKARANDAKARANDAKARANASAEALAAARRLEAMMEAALESSDD